MTPPKHSLLEGDIGAHIRRLALPLAGGMMAMTLFSVADTFFISRLGTKYLAALGFTLPMVMFFLGVTFGLSIGTTSVLSRVYGEGEFEKLKQMSTDALTLSLLITISVSIVGIFMIDPVFRLMGATDEILPYIHRYMTVWYFGFPLFGLVMVGNSCMRAMGDTRYASLMMILMAAIQICLDPILILGIGDFDGFALMGAAMTLAISYALVAGLSVYMLARHKKILSATLLHPDTVKHWKRLLHIAVPAMISNLVSPVSAAVITWMAASYGKEAVAALGVASRVEHMCLLIFYSIGAGTSIFVGQNFGAGNYGRIVQASRISARYALAWGVVVAAVIWPFAYDIPALFDKNPNVIAYAAQYFHWVPISYGAMGAMLTANAALNAVGKPFSATVLIIMRAVVIYIPAAYFLQDQMGFLGIIVALTATNFAVGLISLVWNRKAVG